jgi:iron complex outermembrane receptor protein
LIHPTTAIGLACLLSQLAWAGTPVGPAASARPQQGPISEQDYLVDVPTVISVSRLTQTLAETPGAVTILDRDFIRQSGARSVVEVLRFVPGFQTTTSFESDAPMATYHGRSDDWANRIQVLVDGRSVYSSLLQGSAGIGWQTLALDDIERIEVLRGSNSATYGARAFLGVVNIVSRDVRETQGTSASVSRGENGIGDLGASMGWSQGDATFRISADSANDDGLKGAYGRNHIERLNLAAHLALERGAELDLRAGGVGVYSGHGSADDIAGNPQRRWSETSQFVQADWRLPLSDTQDLSLSVSHTENTNTDRYHYMTPGPYLGATVDFGGLEVVNTATAQHTLRLNENLRAVWGGELRQERIISPPMFDVLGGVTTDFMRLFGSAEWRLSGDLLLNAGALAEHSNNDGDSLSPRLMLNWSPAPGHTLRAGASTAFRPPSAFEKFGQVQYRDANGQNPTGYYTYNDGSVRPEKLLAQELGYFFAPPASNLSGDVRVFQERITDGISATESAIYPGVDPRHSLNGQDLLIQGLELQTSWSPGPATRLVLAQNWTTIEVHGSPGRETQFRAEHGAPRYAVSLALMHSFGQGTHLTLSHQQADDVALMSISDNKWLFSMRRTDLRLAQDLRLGGRRAELALVVQNMDNPYQDGDHKFYFQRQAYLSLKFDY